MKKQLMVIAGLVTVFTLSLSSASFAATPAEREKNQIKRIHQGIKSGELNRAEAHRLVNNEKKINMERRRFWSDGKLSGREKAKLHRDINVQSRRIYNQKHDYQTRRNFNYGHAVRCN